MSNRFHLLCSATARVIASSVAIPLVAVALASCLDGQIGPPTGDPQPAVPDASTPADGSAPAVDAASPDAAIPDAQTPDAMALRTCDEIYDQAPEYSLCEQLPTTCEFAVQTNQGSCRQLCGNYGGECLEAYDNDEGAECVRKLTGDTCDTQRQTEICICSRFP